MRQQINLLTVRTRHRGVLWWTVCVTVVFQTAFVAWLGAEHVRWVDLSEAHTRTVQATADVKAQVIVQKKALGVDEAQDLGTKSVQLRQSLDQSKVWTDLWSKGELGQLDGPVGLLTTLAQVHEDGVWLEQVESSFGGQRLRVRGTALTLDSVLRYADRLSHRVGQGQLLSVKTTEALGPVTVAGQPPVPLVHFELY